MKKTVLFVDGPATGKVVHGVKRDYFTWWVESKKVEYTIHKFLYNTKYYFVAAINPSNLLPSKVIQMICDSGIDGCDA